MNNIYENAVEVARRTMTLFFVVDTSGSMGGSKIGTLNSAIEEVIPEIRKISGENADAAIKIAVLDFSSGAHWITPAPIDAESFCWNYLDADGLTDFGEMCKMLNEKLSRNAFMRDVAGSFAPAIFLLSDGEPTDERARKAQGKQLVQKGYQGCCCNRRGRKPRRACGVYGQQGSRCCGSHT